MNKIGLGDKLKYRVDNTMSKGSGVLILYLLLLAVIFILVVSIIVAAVRIVSDKNFAEIIWKVMTFTIDQGTITAEDGAWVYRLSMLFVTIVGIVLLSTLIGIVTTGIDSKLQELRKGKSRVIERNHTVILGWSHQVFHIIREIVIAHKNKRDSCIVILADRDKVEMEDEIKARIRNMGNTRVICRTGDPIEMSNLDIVSLNTARSIIILSPDGEDPDIEVIKIILAIVNNPHRKEGKYHIVAEIKDEKNLIVAKMVGKDEVELISSEDLISRIIAQTSRQTGLSIVYGELLNFEGNEIYFHREPSLAGITFGESLFKYETSSVIGILREEKVLLNPEKDEIIDKDDSLIVIAEDDTSTHLSGNEEIDIDFDAINSRERKKEKPERILLLGWNRKGVRVIEQLDHYVPPGSHLQIVANIKKIKEEISLNRKKLKNLKVHFKNGDTTDRRLLNSLKLKDVSHVIILCYSDILSVHEADAHTLMTLIHLRDIAEKKGYKFSIVSEILDERNRSLIEVTKVDDFIVTNKLISQILAQISENRHLSRIYSEIFDPSGSEIYLKPVEDYVKPGREVSFYTVVESAKEKSEIAIGYRLARFCKDPDKSYGVKLNPVKTEKIIFSEDDRIIVIAED